MHGSFTDHFNTAVLLWWLFQMLLFSVTDRDEQENGGSGKRVPQLTQTHTHTQAHQKQPPSAANNNSARKRERKKKSGEHYTQTHSHTHRQTAWQQHFLIG